MRNVCIQPFKRKGTIKFIQPEQVIKEKLFHWAPVFLAYERPLAMEKEPKSFCGNNSFQFEDPPAIQSICTILNDDANISL
jgi:hypothetical protein